MARQTDNISRFTTDELARLLKDFWLITSSKTMEEVISRIVDAYNREFPLSVVYESGEVPIVPEVLSALDIKHTVHIRRSETIDTGNGEKWQEVIDPPLYGDLRRLSTVRVPDLARRFHRMWREYDFELLVPFYFERNVQRLSPQLQTKELQVEGVFLLYLLHMVSWRTKRLNDIIESAIRNAKSDVVSEPKSFPLTVLDEYFYKEQIAALPKTACMYLGLDFESGGENEIPYSPGTKNHMINILADEFELERLAQRRTDYDFDVIANHLGGRRSSSDVGPFPRLKTAVRFSVDDIGLAARNLSYHLSHSVDRIDDVYRCLRMRLLGKGEEEIRQQLGFDDKISYDNWLSDNYIDTTIRKQDNALKPAEIVKRWEQARDRLFEGREDLKDELSELLGPLEDSEARRSMTTSTRTPAFTSGNPFESMPDLKWEEVSITFITDEAVLVEARGKQKKFNYTELGFKDGRKADRPDSRWLILRELAEKGEISFQVDASKEVRSLAKSAVKDIRRRLKISLKISGDPFLNYRSAKAYKPRFQLKNAPS